MDDLALHSQGGKVTGAGWRQALVSRAGTWRKQAQRTAPTFCPGSAGHVYEDRCAAGWHGMRFTHSAGRAFAHLAQPCRAAAAAGLRRGAPGAGREPARRGRRAGPAVTRGTRRPGPGTPVMAASDARA